MTAEWSEGYVSDVNYTFGFYRELAPVHIQQVATMRRVLSPSPAAPLNYCELGCGQGYTTNVLAAANPHVQFFATDFNPSQAIGASSLARDTGLTNVKFYDDSFAEFANRADLPQFDFISLHGIYSWISAENRTHIIEFIRRKLKVGGIVYISYNSMPGWAATLPLRRLMVDQADRLGAEPILSRIESALSSVSAIMDGNAAYFKINPTVGERFTRLKEQPRRYLAHEYFNRDWTPFYFADVAKDMAKAKLDWMASASIIDSLLSLSLSTEHQKLLAGVSSPLEKETLKDYLINQQFRRDFFIKGALELSSQDGDALWRESRYMLTVPATRINLNVKTAAGQIQLQPDVYLPLIDILKEGPIAGNELMAACEKRGGNPGLVMQAVHVLSGLNQVQTVLPATGFAERAAVTARFNAEIMRRAQHSADMLVLASPVTGSGVQLDRLGVLFLSAMGRNADPVEFVQSSLDKAGQRILSEGKPVATVAESLSEIRKHYNNFVDGGQLLLCRQLHVI